MNFKDNKESLESAFGVLKHQISSTTENWKDKVQERYYKEYLDDLPKEFRIYIEALDKLEQSFKNAEDEINNLLNQN